MNKAELIEKVAEATGSSKAEAAKAVNAVFETITKALKKGDSVTLIGFGTFAVSKQKARKGRNPQTGETIKIKARKVPKFRPGKALKEAVGGKKK
ncbi:MAG: HU family DNA-binding protein [Nitrospirae bacterium]|nr:HU family DNA-binding protein [Nitrospirota bacterium]